MCINNKRLDKKKQKIKASKKESREEKLAAALRKNLRIRKSEK